MEKFKIAVQWQSYARIEIEAESLDKAVEEIELNSDEIVLPEDWDVVEGSIEVNRQQVEADYPDTEFHEEFPRRELEAKDMGVVDKEPQKAEEICDDEEREARRHLDQLGEGYEQDSEDEESDEEG